MEIGTIRGLLTAVLMLLFIGVALWAFSRRRKDAFTEAANMPLEDDSRPSPKPESANKESRQ